MYPLWVCPFKLYDQPGFVHPSHGKDELYVDIGAYGAPKVDNYNNVETTRKLEAFVSEVNGYVIWDICLTIYCYMSGMPNYLLLYEGLA